MMRDAGTRSWHSCLPRRSESSLRCPVAHRSRLALVALVLLAWAAPARAYFNGDDEPVCFLDKKVLAEGCPTGLTLKWLQAPPSQVLERAPFSAIYDADFGPLERGEVDGITGIELRDGFYIPHHNMHACRTSLGFCSPLLTPQKDAVTNAELVSHEAAKKSVEDAEFLSEMSLPSGEWWVIAHVRVYTLPSGGQFDISIGKRLSVIPADEEVVASRGVVAAMLALAGVALLSMVVAAALIVQYRDDKFIKASTPSFLFAMCGGGVLACVGVVPFALDPAEWTCIARPWMLGVPLVFVLGLLLVRVHRIALIFANRRQASFGATFLTNKVLLAIVGSLVLVELIVDTVWTAAFPLGPVREYSDQCGAEHQYVMVCSGDSANVFYGVSIVYKALFLIAGMVLAYRTRKVGALFNESRLLLAALYNMCFISLIVLPLQFLLPDQPSALVALRSLGIVFGLVGSIAIMLFAKVYQVRRRRRKQELGLDVTDFKGGGDTRSQMGTTDRTGASSSVGKRSQGYSGGRRASGGTRVYEGESFELETYRDVDDIALLLGDEKARHRLAEASNSLVEALDKENAAGVQSALRELHTLSHRASGGERRGSAAERRGSGVGSDRGKETKEASGSALPARMVPRMERSDSIVSAV